jgi:hypothetical protein
MVSNESGYYRENAFIIEKRKRLAQEEMQTKNATSSQKPPLSAVRCLCCRSLPCPGGVNSRGEAAYARRFSKFKMILPSLFKKTFPRRKGFFALYKSFLSSLTICPSSGKISLFIARRTAPDDPGVEKTALF